MISLSQKKESLQERIENRCGIWLPEE